MRWTVMVGAALVVGALVAASALAGTRSKIEIEIVKPTGESRAEIKGNVSSSDECLPRRKVKIYGVHGHGGTYFLGATRTNKRGKWSEELEGFVKGEQLLEANFPKYIAELTRRKFESSGQPVNCRPDEDSFTL